jgi:tetratricopeptide (TPR) repeat protein
LCFDSLLQLSRKEVKDLLRSKVELPAWMRTRFEDYIENIRGQTLVSNAKVELALKLNEYDEYDEISVQFLIVRAMQLQAERCHHGAILWLRAALQIDPSISDAWFALSNSLDEVGEGELAIHAIEQCISLSDSSTSLGHCAEKMLGLLQHHHITLI